METYNVCQFFVDDSCEYEVKYASAEEAVKAFNRLTKSVGAKIGTTKRVIITDDGDFTNMEWQFGKGITYPPELVTNAIPQSESRNNPSNS